MSNGIVFDLLSTSNFKKGGEIQDRALFEWDFVLRVVNN